MLKKSLKIQQTLVEEALIIIRAKGTVTLKDIAEQTDCNIAAVNYHFKDKASFNKVIIDKVFAECIEWALATERVKVCGSAQETLDLIIEYTTQFLEQNIGVFRYIFSLSDERDYNGTVIDTLLAKFDELFEIILKHLAPILPKLSREQIEMKYSFVFSGYLMGLVFRYSSDKSGRFFDNKNGFIEIMKGCFKDDLITK